MRVRIIFVPYRILSHIKTAIASLYLVSVPSQGNCIIHEFFVIPSFRHFVLFPLGASDLVMTCGAINLIIILFYSILRELISRFISCNCVTTGVLFPQIYHGTLNGNNTPGLHRILKPLLLAMYILLTAIFSSSSQLILSKWNKFI